jgi:LPS O-antigen subunit length determinant protein (WzzB/FepE family)
MISRYDYQTQQIKLQRKSVTDAYDKFLKRVEAAQQISDFYVRESAVKSARKEFNQAEKQSCQIYTSNMKNHDEERIRYSAVSLEEMHKDGQAGIEII